MKRKLIITLLFSSIFLSDNIWSQIIIKGPTCVVPGTKYQYLISNSASWSADASMQACVSGGVLADSAINCTTTVSPFSYVLVEWNSGTSGSVQIKSSAGAASIQVAVTTPLIGGNVETVGKKQSLIYNGIPSVINCSASSGGSCSPQYKYQWQQSQDMLAWSDVIGAMDQNLKLVSGQIITIYYRRRVTEVGSGSVGYSDIATVNVGAQMPTANSIQYSENHKADLAIYFKNDNHKLF